MKPWARNAASSHEFVARFQGPQDEQGDKAVHEGDEFFGLWFHTHPIAHLRRVVTGLVQRPMAFGAKPARWEGAVAPAAMSYVCSRGASQGVRRSGGSIARMDCPTSQAFLATNSMSSTGTGSAPSPRVNEATDSTPCLRHTQRIVAPSRVVSNSNPSRVRKVATVDARRAAPSPAPTHPKKNANHAAR